MAIAFRIAMANPLRNRSASTLLNTKGGTRLNTCTRCPLRTCSTSRRICRAKIESGEAFCGLLRSRRSREGLLSDSDVSDSPESRDFTVAIICNYTNSPATTIRDSRLPPLHTKRATQRGFLLLILLTISTLPPCPLPSSLPNIYHTQRQRELEKAFGGSAGRRIPRPRTLYGFVWGFREEGFDFSRSFGHCAFVRAHITTTWLAFAALICTLRAHTTGLSSHSALSSGAHPNWRGRDTVIAIWPAIMLELLSEVYLVYNSLA